MTEEQKYGGPVVGYVYGNPMIGTSLRIHVWNRPGNRYRAEVRREGAITAQEWCHSFLACVDWFRGLPPETGWDPAGVGPAPRATHLLPQRLPGREEWQYVLGDERALEGWWSSSPCPEGAPEPIVLSDLKEARPSWEAREARPPFTVEQTGRALTRAAHALRWLEGHGPAHDSARRRREAYDLARRVEEFHANHVAWATEAGGEPPARGEDLEERVASLLARLKSMSVVLLDKEVYSCTDHIASGINNDGPEAQLRFLLENNWDVPEWLLQPESNR